MAILDASFTILSAIIIVLSVYVIMTVYNVILNDDIECNKTQPKYLLKNIKNFKGPNEFSPDNSKLTDYYIKTAYNCCSVSENMVNECALIYAIKENCRCLDFEIHDIGGKPVVGTTLNRNNGGMDSFNSIKLEEVFTIVSSLPFDREFSSCNRDPLIINLRIKSKLPIVYNIIAELLLRKLNSRLLQSQYSYTNHLKLIESDENADKSPKVLTTNLTELLGNIIISISDCDIKTLKNTRLAGLANIVADTQNKCILQNQYSSHFIQVNDSQTLKLFDKSSGDLNKLSNNFAISIPYDKKYKNVNYCYHKQAKVNMIGMLFQKKIPSYYRRALSTLDNFRSGADLIEYEKIGNLDNYILWFARNEHAFIHQNYDIDMNAQEDNSDA